MAKPDWGELQQRFLSEHAATGVSPKEWCEAQGLNYATARRYIKKTSAQTAQKSAQKKVRIAQKEQSANELMDDDGLTAQQRLFVAEYLKDGNATQAAIRAGYSKKSAEQIGYQLLQKTSVAQAIAQQQKASIARTLGGADEVLAQMWQLATFDANQLSQYRRGACRYCWGFGHQYQWRDMVEFEEKRLEALERKSREPADVGGYGYDHNREPNPACPRCNGDGIGQLRDSFGGVGNALKAMLSMVTPARVAIGGLAGAVLLAAKAGSDYFTAYDEINKAIIRTGNIAGTSALQIMASSQSISASTGATVGTVQSLMTELVGIGSMSQQQLEKATKATALAVETGIVSTQDITKAYKDIEKDPVKALQNLNEQFNFLTVSQLKHIDELVKQKDQTAAVTQAMDLFADTMAERGEQAYDSLTPFGRLWLDIKGWASEAMQRIGQWVTPLNLPVLPDMYV